MKVPPECGPLQCCRQINKLREGEKGDEAVSNQSNFIRER